MLNLNLSASSLIAQVVTTYEAGKQQTKTQYK
jgi:hypothetical protein